MIPLPRLLLSVSTAVCLLAGGTPAHTADSTDAVSFDDSVILERHWPDWFKPSFLDFREDLAEAGENGKLGVMFFFDTEGCAYCKMFVRHTLSDPGIQAELRKHFDVIGVDMFGDVEVTDLSGEALPARVFAKAEGAAVSPTLVFRAPNGELLFRAVGYYPPDRFRTLLQYIVGGHHKEQRFRQYAESVHSGSETPSGTRAMSDPLFQSPPYRLDGRASSDARPLVVLFEADSCDECRRLHGDVLSEDSVRDLLGRYDAVRLDWADAGTSLVTPDGRSSTPASWATELNLSRAPAFVFFDRSGQEVFRLESLVLRQRLERALLYVLDKAYERGMTYQEFTRMKTIEGLKAQSGDS